jgi:hypothetical protein
VQYSIVTPAFIALPSKSILFVAEVWVNIPRSLNSPTQLALPATPSRICSRTPRDSVEFKFEALMDLPQSIFYNGRTLAVREDKLLFRPAATAAPSETRAQLMDSVAETNGSTATTS